MTGGCARPSLSDVRLAAVLVLLALAAPAALAGTDPRAEQVRLNKADQALARRATVRVGDLSAGWRRISAGADESEVPTCPGYAPDFSRFVITGKSRSAFQSGVGASIISSVEVYRSRSDAVGDFQLGTQPAVARCLRHLLDRQFDAVQTVLGKVVSSRRVPAPKLGERAAAYRLVAELTSNGVSLKVYVDVLVFQRGRSIAALFFTGAFEPVGGRTPVARAVAARLR
jgi:hypothetical protein